MQQSIITKTKKWLGTDGIVFFRGLQKKYGRVDAIWNESGIPHVVHFREGMQVRNFLRTISECKKWDSHKLDNTWIEIIQGAIK